MTSKIFRKRSNFRSMSLFFFMNFFVSFYYTTTMFGLGTPEILIIAVVLVLLFGAKKIPDLMKGLGSGVKEFKKASTLPEEEEEKNQSKAL